MFGVLPVVFGLLFPWLYLHVPEKSGRACANVTVSTPSARATARTRVDRFMVQTPRLRRLRLVDELFLRIDEGEAAGVDRGCSVLRKKTLDDDFRADEVLFPQ